jgi:GABA(A) receptor-associated protein
MFQFQKTHTLEDRKAEATRIIRKYPDRIPVIVEKAPTSQIPDLDKHKFLVPTDLTVAQFIYIIRKRIKLSPDQAIYIFINNTLPTTSELMSQLYEKHKDESGFLMILYSGESTFG